MTGMAEEEVASQLSLKRLVSLFALGGSFELVLDRQYSNKTKDPYYNLSIIRMM
jgi:hypothetical protein